MNETLPDSFEFDPDTKEPLPEKPPKGLSLTTLWQVILGLVNIMRELQVEIENLRAELRLQRAKRFGKSSEKQDASSQKGGQDSSDSKGERDTASTPESDLPEQPSDASTAPLPPKKRKRGGQPGHKGHGRHIPEHLPRETQWVELAEEEQRCPHCGRAYRETQLTADSEEVDVQVKVRVIVYRRKRYEKQCECDIPRLITAPVPPKVIPKGKFSSASWAKFFLDKYYANVPLSRQIAKLSLVGLPVSKGTLVGGFKYLRTYLEPLYEYCLEHLRTAERLHADETSWRVFEEIEGKTGHRWWLWVFLSAEVVGYVLDPSRSAAVAKRTLGTPVSAAEAARLSQQEPELEINWLDGQAYLLTPHLKIISADRYAVYPAISPHYRIAFCWSHVRRDFTDFQKAHANQPELANWAADWIADIARIYALNKARLAVRDHPEHFAQAHAALEAALEEMAQKRDVLTELTTKQQKILTSMKNHWEGLLLFVDDPAIPMDNNIAERMLRTPVTGRKNYYGHQVQWAGELAAILFTIIQTCLVNGINPYLFLVTYFNECARLGAAPVDLNPFAPWILKDNCPPELVLKPP